MRERSLFLASLGSLLSLTSLSCTEEAPEEGDPAYHRPVSESSLIRLESPRPDDIHIATDTVFVFAAEPGYLQGQDFTYFERHLWLGPHKLVHAPDRSSAGRELSFKLEPGVILEDGSYELTYRMPRSGNEYAIPFIKKSRVHLSGMRFERAPSGRVEATVSFSEPVRIEDEAQLCLIDAAQQRTCLAPALAGEVGQDFTFELELDVTAPLRVEIDKNLRSLDPAYLLNITDWQKQNPHYKYLARVPDLLFVDFQNGINEFACEKDTYCWGSYIP